jgi:hypothetical protein
MDKNPRKFILTVTEIDIELLPGEQQDEIEVIFCGKTMPSTKDRLSKCVTSDRVYFRDIKLM